MHHAPPINIDVLSPSSFFQSRGEVYYPRFGGGKNGRMNGLLPSTFFSSHPHLIFVSRFFQKRWKLAGKSGEKERVFLSHPPPLRPLCIPLPTALGEGRRTRPPARNFYKSSQCQLQIGGRSRRGGERGEEEEEEVGPVVALLFPPRSS